MALKECKYCKSEIDKKATHCKYCGKGQGNKVAQVIIFTIGIFALIYCLCILFMPSLDYETVNEIYGTIENSDNLLTLEKFNSIKTGMTYEEVVSIIGEEGNLLSETDIGYKEYATKIYSWYGRGDIGANANFTFQNNKLVNKTQIGLK